MNFQCEIGVLMLSINPLKLTSKSLISDYYLILQKKMEAEHKVEKNKNTLYNDLFVFNNQFRKEVQGLT